VFVEVMNCIVISFFSVLSFCRFVFLSVSVCPFAAVVANKDFYTLCSEKKHPLTFSFISPCVRI